MRPVLPLAGLALIGLMVLFGATEAHALCVPDLSLRSNQSGDDYAVALVDSLCRAKQGLTRSIIVATDDAHAILYKITNAEYVRHARVLQEAKLPVMSHVTLGLVLGVITVVLLPIVLRIVSGLLEIGMPLMVGYVFRTITICQSPPCLSRQECTGGSFLRDGRGLRRCLFGMYVPIDVIQHGFRHGRWTLPNNWHDDAPCRYCSEDEVVNEYLVALCGGSPRRCRLSGGR